jgi:hypothetical protein
MIIMIMEMWVQTITSLLLSLSSLFRSSNIIEDYNNYIILSVKNILIMEAGFR